MALILALFFPVSTYTYYLLLTYPEYILGGHVQNMKMVFNISTLSDGLGIQQQNLIFFPLVFTAAANVKSLMFNGANRG